MDKIPLTPRGAQKLREELLMLTSEERPAVIEAIATAREYGDLKENAEYHAAREKQGLIESRIKEIEAVISRAQVIDPTTLGGDTVKFGATVTIVYLDEDNRTQRYQIVGAPEADISFGWLSLASPVGRALIGKKQGEIVTIKSPKGEQVCEIAKVEYI